MVGREKGLVQDSKGHVPRQQICRYELFSVYIVVALSAVSNHACVWNGHIMAMDLATCFDISSVHLEQKEAIDSVLIVILPTGFGKSFINQYQSVHYQ